MEKNDDQVILRLKRSGGEIAEYAVPWRRGMNILSALQYIYEEMDRTIAYPLCLCKSGVCGACAVRVNGRPALGCAVQLRPGEELGLEPLTDKNVIKDLVCGTAAAAERSGAAE